MRFAVIVFSLLLVFTPVYSYAFVWFGAGAVKGMIARTGLGQFVKINSKRAFAGSVIWGGAEITEKGVQIAKAYCKRSKKCDDIIENASDLFGDDDDTVKGCLGVIYFIGSNNNKSTNLDDIVSSEIDKAINDARKYYSTTQYVSHSQDFSDLIAEAQRNIDERVKRQVKSTTKDIYTYRKQQFIDTTVTLGNSTINRKVGYSIAVKADYLCDDDVPDDKKQEIKIEKEQVKKEQIEKIVNNLSDDDVTYIINNYGDEIDVEKYCSENSCDELSNEFGQEVQNNQNKYDIDKINKQNCVVKNGKIVSCDNAKIEQDEEESTEEETTEESTEQETEETTEDKKINCNASEFHKKVCDFIDWYQDDFEHDNTDTGVDVDDKSDDLPKHKDYIKFNAQCPPDKIINLSFAGVNKSLNWTYQDFCHAMTELKPFIVGFSMITGAFIIAGRRV